MSISHNILVNSCCQILMKNLIKNSLLLFLLFLLVSTSGKAQRNPVVDSLLNIVSSVSDTTKKVEALYKIAVELKDVDYKNATTYANKSIALAKKANYTHGLINSLIILAQLDHSKGNYAEALIKLKEALEFSKKEKDNTAIAQCFLSIGDVYSTLKSYDKAISNYEKCEDLSRQEKNDETTIVALGRIGNRYMDIGNETNDTNHIVKAIAIYEKGRKLSEHINDTKKIINAYVNLADAFIILGKKTKNKNYFFWSIDYSLRSMKLSRKFNYPKSESIGLLNIGEAYENLGKTSKAIHYYEISLVKYEALKDKNWMMNIHKSLANAYLTLNNYPKSIEHVESGIKLAKEEDLKVYLRDYYAILMKIYSKQNDFKKAFETQQLYTAYKDSIINENTSLSIARLQTELELDKKDLEIELLNRNAEVQNEKIRAQAIQRNYLIAGIVVIFILLLFIYYRYLEKNKIQEEIIRAKEIAEQAKETQEQFLANTSHEIRTPMNGIIGMTNQLIDTPLTGDQREYLNAISESANSLLVIINDLLDFSKINAGKMTFAKEPLKITELFKNLIYSLQYRSTEKNIRLISSVDEKIPLTLLGDSVRLNQILLNLTGNAIKFTEKGEVKIAAKLLKDDGKKILVLFSVQDTGIGIPKDNLKTIFDSFTQASSRTNRKYGGTGLGLAIAKQLIEQQGGTISVSSKVNEGSVFLFTLPFKIQEKGRKKIKVIGKDVLDFNQPDLLGVSILVVDDNKINQRVAALTLQKWNAHIELAGSANIAFEIIKNKKTDLILMDITMPDIDGFEATQYIRKKMPAPLNNIPIIAMTASALVGDREKCISMGMNEYISKPFNPEELYTKIVTVLALENRFINEPIVDLTTLNERAEGDKEYLKEIILSYIQEMPIYVGEMNRFLNEKNRDQIRKQAHKMKSPAKLLGAFELATQLEFIEKSIDGQEVFEKIINSVEQMNSLCMFSVEALKKELSRMGS